MARAVGPEIKAAAKLATVWGTATACGVHDGILIRPPSLNKERPYSLDDSLGMGYFPNDSVVGEIAVQGSLPAYLRYAGFELLLALAMGGHAVDYTTPKASGAADSGNTTSLTKTGAFTTTVAGDYIRIVHDPGGTPVVFVRKVTSRTDDTVNWSGATTAIVAGDTFKVCQHVATHTLTLADSLDGLFATLAFSNNIFVEELTTAKIAGFTLRGSTGKRVEAEFDIVAIDKTTGSSTNTLVTMAGVTHRETANVLMFNDVVFRMNAQAGAALDSGDIIYPTSWQLSYKRPMRGVYGVGGVSTLIDEPSGDGVAVIEQSFTFPRVSSSAYLDSWEAGDEKKMDITFTGGLLADAATARSLFIEMPKLKFKKSEAPIVDGIMENPSEFSVLGCLVAPTGMTALTLPFRMTLVNGWGGEPLQVGN